MPEFFVTGNPADVHHPLLFHLGGEKINATLLMKKVVIYKLHKQ
jgi:hypothetical protein